LSSIYASLMHRFNTSSLCKSLYPPPLMVAPILLEILLKGSRNARATFYNHFLYMLRPLVILTNWILVDTRR
jgi:hypothetical protein